MKQHFLLTIACLLVPTSVLRAAETAETVDYVRDIQPILTKHCVACHGPKKQEAGLRVDRSALLIEGGDSGATLVAGKSAESLLIKAITGTSDGERMPLERPPLTAAQIELLGNWIDQGAKAPQQGEPTVSERIKSDHWAFQQVVRPALPKVRNAKWPRNEIDHFVLARLERAGIAPSPEADRATLMRRLHLDLIGIAPSPEELDAFLKDTRDDAYQRLVDQLLASPHYGERWGRHWLDVVRYADSAGFESDVARPVWKFRDWVINALNRDHPFNQFAIEQIAGDLLPGATREQLTATGMHCNSMQEGGSEPERLLSVVDRVNTTGTVFLALTLGCAQCHSHKLEPISQKEYYGLFAFFNNAQRSELEFAAPSEIAQRDALRAQLVALQQELETYKKTLQARRPAWEAALTDEARKKFAPAVQASLKVAADRRNMAQQQTVMNVLQSQDPGYLKRTETIESLEAREPKFVKTLTMKQPEKPRPTHVFLRGEFSRPGKQVTAGVPSVLPPLQVSSGTPTRLDFARWIASDDNPLTARVTVNRIWQRYFGLGLVETEDDFGTQGALPSHPQLLDWLAAEFVQCGWSMKQLHRRIVTSATYRQSSHARPQVAENDPKNRLLARMPRLSLEAEIIRDQALSAAGLLNLKLGGPSVFPYQAKGVMDGRAGREKWTISPGKDRYRRGLYTHFWRATPHPFLELFGAPDAVAACTRRDHSVTPLQSLTLLNDPMFVECARHIAGRLLAWPTTSDDERIDLAFRLCFSRHAEPEERKLLGTLLQRKLAELKTDADRAQKIAGPDLSPEIDLAQRAAWTELARVLLNTDEFITRQ